MSFAENLKQIRKERGLSQEELADMLEVSRQTISKWELGEGYPEVEKLLRLSGCFNISLDTLMSAEIVGESSTKGSGLSGSIVIFSPHENVVARCCKVMSSQEMKGGDRSPKYSLFGVSGEGSSVWGEAATFLGWYADEETLSKEIREIHQAITAGRPNYELQYSVKTERKWLSVTMVEK